MAIKTDNYEIDKWQANYEHIASVIHVKHQYLVWTRLMGSLKEKSPRDKYWLSSHSCQAIWSGQATQHDVTGFLQWRILSDRDNDGQVTKKSKNGRGTINDSEENVVDVGDRVIPCDADPNRQPTDVTMFVLCHFLLPSEVIDKAASAKAEN